MASDKDPSESKTTQQTISISSNLKDRIEAYVNTNQQKDPEDKRFKSMSAFYGYVMEKVIDILDEGKTLDDLKRFIGSGTRDFLDQFTFRGIIPFHELVTKANRYKKLDYKKIPGFLYAMREVYLSGTETNLYDRIKKQFEVLKAFFMANNLTRDIKLEIFSEGNPRYPKGIFEHSGIYKNLFIENCKLTAAILGIIGAKITETILSVKDLYIRFNIEATDLVYREDFAKNERMKLVDHNSNFLINYKEMINDEDYYLWMNLAEDKDISINFNNENTKKKWLDLIIKDLNKLCYEEEFALNLLRFFDKLHWIDIENEIEPSFRFRLSKEKHNEEREFLLELLSKYSKISEYEGRYYLE